MTCAGEQDLLLQQGTSRESGRLPRAEGPQLRRGLVGPYLGHGLGGPVRRIRRGVHGAGARHPGRRGYRRQRSIRPAKERGDRLYGGGLPPFTVENATVNADVWNSLPEEFRDIL